MDEYLNEFSHNRLVAYTQASVQVSSTQFRRPITFTWFDCSKNYYNICMLISRHHTKYKLAVERSKTCWWAIFEIHFNETMMISAVYYTNTLSWNFIVLTHWNNCLQVDMSLYSDTLSWFCAKPVFALTP